MKIFGKTLKEYLWPIKYYIIVSVLIVISQYTVGLPLSDKYPIILNITQWVWELMIALSVIKLVRKYNFNIKNVFLLGVIYSIIIHGLKISIRYFFYDRTFWYLLGRFLYGSFLVMAVALPVGIAFIYFKKNPLKLTKKDIIHVVIALALSAIIIWFIMRTSLVETFYRLITFNR